MQCKDISGLPILRFLASLNGKWANWAGNEYPNSVTHAMPTDAPKKLAHAKMNTLIRRGLVDGCSCGCRGDYVLTEKGKELLELIGEQS